MDKLNTLTNEFKPKWLMYDGELFYCTSNNLIKEWKFEPGEESRVNFFIGHKAEILCVDFSTSRIYSGAKDGTIIVHFTKTKEVEQRLSVGQQEISTIKLSKNSDTIYVSSGKFIYFISCSTGGVAEKKNSSTQQK